MLNLHFLFRNLIIVSFILIVSTHIYYNNCYLYSCDVNGYIHYTIVTTIVTTIVNTIVTDHHIICRLREQLSIMNSTSSTIVVLQNIVTKVELYVYSARKCSAL